MIASQLPLVSLLLALTLAAGQPPPSTGASAQITGRVLDDLSSEPLANARVFLYPVPFPAGSRPPLAITNESGEYVFKGLEPGAYHLGVNRPGFFPAFPVTATRVSLVDGDRRDGVDLLMSRGGVLAGTVLDESGKPLSNVWVGALRLNEIERLERSGSVSGCGAHRCEWRVSIGNHPARSVRVVANRTTDQVGQETDSITYFPGTSDLSRAQFLRLGPRETVDGLDFKVMPAQTFGVTGFAIDEAGRPASGWQISLEADRPLFGGPKGSSRSDGEGHFQIRHLSPGDYRLTATNWGSQPGAATRQAPFLRVTVIDADVSGLVIQVPIR